MKRLVGLVFIFLIVMTTGVYGNEKERFCNNYANTAVKQYNQAKKYRVPGINPPAWSSDRNGHYFWCMMTPENIANNENAKRQAYLDRYLQENNHRKSNARSNKNSDSWHSSPLHIESGQAVDRGNALPKSMRARTPKNSSRHAVVPNFDRLNHTERNRRPNNGNNVDNRKTDDGSGNGGVNGGIGGMANKPGGNWEPGSENKTPPFEDDNGLGDIYGNKAGHRPNDHIKNPDQMGPGDASSPAQNLYGPTGKPLPGLGGVAGGKKDKSGNHWVKKSLAEMAAGWGGDLRKLYNALKKKGKSTDITGTVATGVSLYFIKIKNNGSTYTLVYDVSGRTAKLVDRKKEGKSLDGSGDEGGREPLSAKERKMINDAKAAAAYDDILNFIPIQNDGGVVDPVRNQANGESGGQNGERNKGRASGSHGKAPKIAKQPGSHRPGSDLTGPGRVDRPKPGKSVKLPQGFHVIDPAANKGAISDRANSNQDIQIAPHRVK